MRNVRAIATDYDETLAEIGFVPDRHLRAMERFRASGRMLILNTGRGLEDLLMVFPEISRFDALVLENGTILVDPVTKKELLLADPLPQSFLDDLRRRGVSPIPKRRVIVDTWAIHEGQIREAIHQAGLNLHLIFNQNTVMILPSGMDKGSGLRASLAGTGIELAEVAGIGDGDNDFGLLDACGVKVAVPNAIPELIAKADHVLTFEELVDAILIQ
jgi:hydroxymethylpyrimidine pyrophosphatase-like HAD family hydrolase